MTQDLLIALAGFALVTSITPGPNNLMLMASGANFGLRRSVPHMLGIGIGFVVMILGVGAGLASIFTTWPYARPFLQVFCTLYMLWLAWKIARAAAPSGTTDASARPLTFLQAAAFQWVNPKAWAMALTAVTVYAPPHATSLIPLLSVALVFGAINLPAVSLWTLAGQQMRRWLTAPGALRLFNLTMAALLIASLWPILAAI